MTARLRELALEIPVHEVTQRRFRAELRFLLDHHGDKARIRALEEHLSTVRVILRDLRSERDKLRRNERAAAPRDAWQLIFEARAALFAAYRALEQPGILPAVHPLIRDLGDWLAANTRSTAP